MTDGAATSKRTLLAYGLGKVIPGLLLFLAVPLWTRTFGAEQYGFYSIAWSIALFSSSLFTGWLRQALLRHSGNDAATLQSLPRWTIPAASVLSSAPVVLLVLLQLDRVENGTLFVVAAGVFAVLNSTYAVYQASAQRAGRSFTYTLAEVLRVGGAVVISLLLGAANVTEGAICIILGFCVSTLASLLVLERTRFSRHAVEAVLEAVPRDEATLSKFWGYGWPMAIWLAASSLLLYQDRVIISSVLGASAAGEYAAVADVIVRGFAMVSFPLTMVSHPIIMAAWNRGEPSVALATNRTFKKYLIWISVAIFLAGSFFGRSVLELVLGIDIESTFLVPLLLAGAALWQVGLMTHKELEMEDRTKLMAALIVIIAVGSAVTNLLTAGWLGLTGPAAVFATGAGIYALSTYVLGARLRRKSSHV